MVILLFLAFSFLLFSVANGVWSPILTGFACLLVHRQDWPAKQWTVGVLTPWAVAPGLGNTCVSVHIESGANWAMTPRPNKCVYRIIMCIVHGLPLHSRQITVGGLGARGWCWLVDASRGKKGAPGTEWSWWFCLVTTDTTGTIRTSADKIKNLGNRSNPGFWGQVIR